MKLIRSLQLFTTVVFGLFIATTSRAGTHTWTGGGANEFWNNAANWSGGAPTAGEAAPVTLIFPSFVVTTNNIAGLTVDSLVFNGTATTLHGSGGGTLTFRGAGGVNLLTTYENNTDITIAATLPVTMSGSNYFSIDASYHNVSILSVVSGSGSVTLDGGGNLYLGGTQANTITGKLMVQYGTAYLTKTAGVNAVAGPVETKVGAAAGIIVIQNASQIPDANAVTIGVGGLLRLYADETLSNLTLAGGTVQSFGGTLILSGNLAATAASSTISAPISLGGATRTFNVANTAALTISGVIANGAAAAGVTKSGLGTLSLGGANTFTGAASVTGGKLALSNNDALGTTAGGLIVNSGCELQLSSVSIGTEAISLNGNLSILGTNTLSGAVTIASEITMTLPTNTQLTLSGVLGGAGPVSKTGAGTLVLSGASGNTHTGGIEVNGGTLSLNKSSGSALVGSLTVESGATVRLQAANQIGNSAVVTVQTGGTLDLNSFSDNIGSLAGNGSVSLGSATLTNGGNGNSTTFSGVISGSGSAPIVKTGGSTLILSATNTCTGTSQVIAGTLEVNGSLPGPVTVSGGGGLSGSGKIGNLTSASGNINPGAGFGIGKFTVASLALSNVAVQVVFEIAGTAPGSDHDQLAVIGTVTLNNPTLTLLTWTAGALGNQHVLIDNDGVDAVSGTFNGLPEGATVTVGLNQYTISYQGGTGNDVVLTQTATPPPPQITAITKGPGGVIQLTGSGLANTAYHIQAKGNLSTTNWVSIGAANANGSGVLNFTDEEASLHPIRFYRLLLP